MTPSHKKGDDVNKSGTYKDIYNKKRIILIIILVSLIFHLLLFFALVNTHFKKSLSKAIQTFQEKIQRLPRTQLPASLKPKQSQFGDPVFFDFSDKPQDQPQEASQKQAPLEPSMSLSEQLHQELEKEINKSENLEKKENKIPQKEDSNQKIDTPKTSIIEETKTEVKKTLPQAQPIQKPVLQKEPLKTTKKELEEHPKSKPQPIQQPAQKKRNLIAMTKGFLENLKNKGDDDLERKGDDNKRPDFSEYKYLSYEARINWQLQATWKQNNDPLQRPHEGKVAIEFVLDQHGNLADLKLRQSSGNRDLDAMVLENTRRAAPFPPLPQHFKTEFYKTGRIIKVSAYQYGF